MGSGSSMYWTGCVNNRPLSILTADDICREYRASRSRKTPHQFFIRNQNISILIFKHPGWEEHISHTGYSDAIRYNWKSSASKQIFPAFLFDESDAFLVNCIIFLLYKKVSYTASCGELNPERLKIPFQMSVDFDL